MTKKIVSVILAITLIAVSLGCGKKAVNTEKQNATDVNKQAQTEQPKDEETVEKEQSKEEPKEASTPKLIYYTKTGELYDDSGKEVLYDSKTPYINLAQQSKEQYKNLSETLENLNKEAEGSEKARAEWMYERSKEDYEKYPDSFMYKYYNYLTYKIIRADEKVLSIEEDFSEYAGGAHGMSGAWSINYDAQTGKEINISDVVLDFTMLPIALNRILTKKYGDIFLFDLMETLYEKGNDYIFTITDDGVIFYFNPYDIASWGEGLLTAFVDFDYMDGLLSKKYASKSNETINAFHANECNVDVDGDGNFDSVKIMGYMGSEYGNYEKIEVSVNDTVQNISFTGVDFEGYVVSAANGKKYLYLDLKDGATIGKVAVYELSKDGITFVGKLEETTFYLGTEEIEEHMMFTDPSSFELIEYESSTGETHTGSYHVGENGMPEKN